MVSCAVANCKNTSVKITKHTNGITFHRFPRDKKRRRQWEVAVNRENWSATTSSAVCSEHFDAKDFYLTDSGLRRLSLEAVPVINISICQPRAATVTELQPADIKPTDSEEVIKLKYKIRRLEIVSSDRKRRIHELWRCKRKLRKKLEHMKNVIKHLIQNKKETGRKQLEDLDLQNMDVNNLVLQNVEIQNSMQSELENMNCLSLPESLHRYTSTVSRIRIAAMLNFTSPLDLAVANCYKQLDSVSGVTCVQFTFYFPKYSGGIAWSDCIKAYCANYMQVTVLDYIKVSQKNSSYCKCYNCFLC